VGKLAYGDRFYGINPSCIRCDYGRQAGFLNRTSREDIEMEPIKFTLCPLCTECPGVEITDEGVRIGEDANTVRLSHAEWNELVALIKRGDLHEV